MFLGHEEGGQELLAIILGQLVAIKDSLKETNEILRLFKECEALSFPIMWLIG